MKRPPRARAGFLALLASLAFVACLEPSRAVLAPLAAGAPRRLPCLGEPVALPVDLAAGDYLRLSIEQSGVDLVVELADPRGRRLVGVDRAASGEEVLSAVAPRSGRHWLTVRPFRPGTRGAFALTLAARRAASESDRREAAARAAFDRAALALARGRTAKSEAALREAAEGWEATGETTDAAFARLRLAYRLRDRGAEPAALAEANAAAEGFAAAGRPAEEGEARILAGALLLARDPRAAAGQATAALALAPARDVRLAAVAWNDLGRARERLGDLEGALAAYDEALARWRDLGDEVQRAITLENQAAAYNILGRGEEALDVLDEALGLLRARGTMEEIAKVLTLRGWIRALAGDPEAAVADYDEALDLFDDAGAGELAQADTRDRRASALRRLGRPGEARREYERALAAFRAAAVREGEAHARVSLADLALAAGRTAEAEEGYRSALALLTALGDLRGEYAARLGLAKTLRATGRPAEAEAELERAVAAVERERAGLTSAGMRQSYLASFFEPYEEWVDLLMERRDEDPEAVTTALAVVERRRSRTLLDWIEAPAGRRPSGDAAERVSRLASRLDAGTAAGGARGGAVPGGAGDLAREIRLALLASDRLRPLPPGVDAPPPADFEEVLDDDVLLLVFGLGRERSFLWAEGEGLRGSWALPGRDEIEGLAASLLAGLADGRSPTGRAQAQAAAAKLSQVLLRPVADMLGERRLAIVADGSLAAVPFDVLPEPGTGEPLVVRHEVVYLPSIAVLRAQRRLVALRPSPERTLAVLADPVFDPADARVAGAPDVEPAAPPADLVRSAAAFDFPGGGFPRLEFTGAEALALAGLVPEGERWLATGFAASREAVLAGRLSGFSFLHFAAHGLDHPDHPELSGIVLSLVGADGRARDGFLRLHEIPDLDLQAELVVLSACRTAHGRDLRGEGLVGLGWGFFAAGARRVVVSSWNVHDQATAELMAHFYRGILREGLAPSAALRRAKLALRADPRWQDPYFWAAFSLHGDWR